LKHKILETFEDAGDLFDKVGHPIGAKLLMYRYVYAKIVNIND
jgi:hypothetical protein